DDAQEIISGKTCRATSGAKSKDSRYTDGEWEDMWELKPGQYVNTSGSCPPEFPVRDSSQNRCWKTEQLPFYFDRTANNTICPAGTAFYSEWGGRFLQTAHQCVANSGGSTLTLSNGRCSNTTYSYSSSTGKCTRESLTNRTYSCPSGGTVNGNQCQTYDYSPFGQYCLDGGEYREED